MKIDVVSDQHLDSHIKIYKNGQRVLFDWTIHKTPDSTVLIDAGDASNSIQETLDYYAEASQFYDRVFVVSGNHTYYDKNFGMLEKERQLSEGVAKLPKVVYLNDTNAFEIYEEVAFIGSNGWYSFDVYKNSGIPKALAYITWQMSMNDYSHCKFFEEPDSLAEQAIEAVSNAAISASFYGLPIVCITHSIPDGRLVAPRYQNDRLTPSFVNTDMFNTITKCADIRAWCFGHTHERSDTMLDGVRCINNARGYANETPGPYSVVQIEL